MAFVRRIRNGKEILIDTVSQIEYVPASSVGSDLPALDAVEAAEAIRRIKSALGDSTEAQTLIDYVMHPILVMQGVRN